jgi:hypothetical protein
MSELQIGLLALGALAVAGVLVFNKVQERRARREGAKHFGSTHDDVLLGSAAPERAGAGGHALPDERAAAAADPVADRIEPTWGDEPDVPAVAPESEPEPAHPAGAVLAPVLDARIDFIAEMSVEEPLLGSHAMFEVEKLARGRNVDADGYNATARCWEALDRNAVYEKLRVGIQISDRSGPLRPDELEAFQKGVSAMATTLGAWVAWPGEQSPLTRAAELDAFCAGVDVLIGINVVAAAPFADTKLRGLGEANGFTREDDGVFRRRDDAGEVLLVLRQGSPESLSLALDVPRVPREAAALGMMAQCAKRLAAGIDGKLVDDNGKPLNDAGVAAIQASLAGIYGRMEAAGMPAGGVLARRVFS